MVGGIYLSFYISVYASIYPPLACSRARGVHTTHRNPGSAVVGLVSCVRGVGLSFESSNRSTQIDSTRPNEPKPICHLISCRGDTSISASFIETLETEFIRSRTAHTRHYTTLHAKRG